MNILNKLLFTEPKTIEEQKRVNAKTHEKFCLCCKKTVTPLQRVKKAEVAPCEINTPLPGKCEPGNQQNLTLSGLLDCVIHPDVLQLMKDILNSKKILP